MEKRLTLSASETERRRITRHASPSVGQIVVRMLDDRICLVSNVSMCR